MNISFQGITRLLLTKIHFYKEIVTLLENSALAGMVDLSTRLKELLL